MILNAPLLITARLLPGVKVGDATISIEPTGDTDHRGKPGWRYMIDAPEWEHEATDLYGWGDAPGMLGTLLSFLGACAESVQYSRSTGRESENEDLFPPCVAEWADANSDEIDMMRFEIEEYAA